MGRVVLEKDQITLELVRHTFDYVQDQLVWRNPKAKWIKVGSVVGCRRNDGYYVTNVFGKSKLVHQLVWFYHYGYWPTLIDHIDRNPTNNSIQNLRISNKSLNAYNSGLQSNNTSGIKGITKVNKSWTACVKISKVWTRKSFKCLGKAIQFRKQQLERNFGQ